MNKKGNFKHGFRSRDNLLKNPDHRLIYWVWEAMHKRCNSKSGQSFKDYVMRGITVCERWCHFEHFMSDMGSHWRRGLMLERLDNNEGYSPENCRWVTRCEQNNNTRRNVTITSHGIIMTVSEWAHVLGVKPQALAFRKRRGWTDDEIIDTPINKNLIRP